MEGTEPSFVQTLAMHTSNNSQWQCYLLWCKK